MTCNREKGMALMGMEPNQIETCLVLPRSGRRAFLRQLAVGLTSLTGCAKPAPYPPHLFACDQRRLVEIATKAAKHEMYPYEIERSSAGDQVRMIVRTSEPRILANRCGG